jgi:YVTN family beta-propeller protein
LPILSRIERKYLVIYLIAIMATSITTTNNQLAVARSELLKQYSTISSSIDLKKSIISNSSQNNYRASFLNSSNQHDRPNIRIDGIKVGVNPRSITVNPKTNMVYVLCSNITTVKDVIYVINGATNKVVNIINIGRGSASEQSIAINPSSNVIYVINQTHILKINGTTNKIVTIVSRPFRQLAGVDVNPNTNMVYILETSSLFNSTILSVMNGTTNKIVNRILLTPIYEGILLTPIYEGRPAMALNPKTNTVYVTNPNSNTISVIDGTTNSIIKTIKVPRNPSTVAVNPKTNTVYVANEGANRISVIDGTTNSIIKTMMFHTFSQQPTSSIAVNPSNNMIYVTRTNTIAVIDGTTNSIIKTLNVGLKPASVSINSKTNLVYIANYMSNTISVIDGTTNSIIMGEIAVGKPVPGIALTNQPLRISVDSNTNKIYIIYRSSNTVSVIDGTTNSIIKTIVVDGVSDDITINQHTNTIYVITNATTSSQNKESTNNSYSTVAVIDGNTDLVVANVRIPGVMLAAAVNPSTDMLYLTDGSVIYSISGLTNKIVSHFAGPVSNIQQHFGIESIIAIDPNTNMLYIPYQFLILPSLRFVGFIAAIDITTNKMMSNFTVGDDASEVAVNPNRSMIYVTDLFSNTVHVIDEYTNIIIDNVTVGNQPVGVAVNPNTNKIYVTNRGSDTLYVIDGSTNNIKKTISLGGGSAYNIDVNPTKVYAISQNPNEIYVVDGKSDNVTAGVNFNVNPSNAGSIYCNGQRTSDNYIIYGIGTILKCETKPNPGYAFSSWSGDPYSNRNDTLTHPTALDYLFGWLSGTSLSSNPSSYPLIRFPVSQYGKLTANFIVPTKISIPQEYLIGLYGVILSFLIPSIASWFNKKRQRKYLSMYKTKIDTLNVTSYQNNDEYLHSLDSIKSEIENLYARGMISDSHYQMLQNKISEKIKKVEKA